MPGVYQRKLPNGKRSKNWTAWWIDEDGKKREKTYGRDKATALDIAKRNDAECLRVRQGLADRKELSHRTARRKPLAEHIEDYRLSLRAKQDGKTHCRDTVTRLVTLCEDAGISGIDDIAPDRIQLALGRLRQRRSPRTCNAYLGSIKAFANWLHASNRIKEVPGGLRLIPRFSEEVDRKRVRRALNQDEFERLIRATEVAPTKEATRGPRKGVRDASKRRTLTGMERAMLYRLAAGTGFRANELRSLTPESFDLNPRHPVVVVGAAYSKRDRNDRQPIRRDLAEALAPFVAATEAGRAVFAVPEKTAKMLRQDMERAGVAYVKDGKVADFHSLRGRFITCLWLTCSNPVVVMQLARHSDIKLTTKTYTTVEDEEKRRALEGEG